MVMKDCYGPFESNFNQILRVLFFSMPLDVPSVALRFAVQPRQPASTADCLGIPVLSIPENVLHQNEVAVLPLVLLH